MVRSFSRIEELYHAALARPAAERGAFLERECSDDAELRAEVESLLAHEQEAKGLLEEPVTEATTQKLAVVRGTRLGPYEVIGLLGAGGMGEVYRARDTRLGRDVAVKVLPEHVSRDPESLGRFAQETRAVAALQHSHICALYDIGRENGIDFAIMELLEGETLRERLSRGGPLSPGKAIELTEQICQGLAVAHAKGIVHRDLKPENLFLTREGVKILDFGLAKRTTRLEGPDLTTPRTQSGLLVGTVGYFSPEQARGELADARSDVFLLGVVLYEMLSGQRAFKKETPAETLAAIIKEDPPELATLPETVAPGLERVLRRCLEKDPEDRFQSARDVGFALEAVSGVSGVPDLEPTTPRGESRALRWSLPTFAVVVAVATLAGVLAVGLWPRSPREAPAAPVVRSQIDLGPERALVSPGPGTHPVRTELALSPDGRHLAWCGYPEDPMQSALFVRRLDGDETRRLPGTEMSSQPFFSPDGRWIGFVAYVGEGQYVLRKVPVEGGLVVDIVAIPGLPMGAVWGPSGRIYLGAEETAGLRWVPAEGGKLQDLTAFDPVRENGHRLPWVLPGERALLMTTLPVALGVKARVEVVSIPTEERRILLEDAADARYLPTGHLVFARRGTLMAVPFDPDRVELKATPVPVVTDISQALNRGHDWSNSGAAQYAFSNLGLLAYGRGGIRTNPEYEIVLLDETGGTEPLPGFERPQVFMGRFSPDGRFFAFTERSAGLWLFDLERRTHRPLRREGHAGMAIWSPDGRRLAVTWTDSGPPSLWLTSIERSDPWERLTNSEDADLVSSWSPDGQVLAFIRAHGQSTDVLLYRFEDRQVVPFLTTDANEGWAEFSPDGRWMAYVSDESGRREVCVTSFPEGGRVLVVSHQGGTAPAWSRDGRRLFYRSLDLKSLWSVSVRSGPSLALGRPTRICATPPWGANPWRGWDLHPDGRRFQFQRLARETVPPPPITRLELVHNWFAELERLAPTRE